MHQAFKYVFTIFLSLVTLTGCDDVLTVYVVRHAEKMSPWSTANPPLSPAGYQRAEALAERLTSTHLDKIIVSNYRRTQETAQPTAEAHGLVPITLPASAIDEIIAEALVDATTRSVLIVGHSNTVPLIIKALEPNADVQEIDESVFSQFHIVVRNKLNQVTIHGQDAYGLP